MHTLKYNGVTFSAGKTPSNGKSNMGNSDVIHSGNASVSQ